MDQTDAAVWQEVCHLLEEPERLEQEYRQRLQPQQKPHEQEGLDAQMGKLRRGLSSVALNCGFPTNIFSLDCCEPACSASLDGAREKCF